MPELAEYEVNLNGNPTTMQLTPEAAKKLGGRPVGAAKSDDSDDGGERDGGQKHRPTSTKLRRPANK